MVHSTSGKKIDADETKRLLTDRGAYISFLEIQLERVSAACFHTQGLENQIQNIHASVEAVEAKLGTMSKLIQMHQTHTGEIVQNSTQDIATIQTAIETLRDTITSQGTQLRRMDARQNELEENASSMESRLQCSMESANVSIETAKETMELHIHRNHTLHEAQKNKWNDLQAAQHDLVREMALMGSRGQHYTDQVRLCLCGEENENVWGNGIYEIGNPDATG